MPAMGQLKTNEDADPEEVVKPLLRVLDKQLEGKEYVCGDLTVADFAIAAYTLTKLGRAMDYSDIPNAAAWRDRVSALKGFVETHVEMPG